MNLTRERIRQVEVKALARLEALREMGSLREFVDEGPIGRRRLPRLSKADVAGMDGQVDEDKLEDTWDSAEPVEDVDEDRPLDLSLFDS